MEPAIFIKHALEKARIQSTVITCVLYPVKSVLSLYRELSEIFDFPSGKFLRELYRVIHEEEQKKTSFFCCSQVVLTLGLLKGFF